MGRKKPDKNQNGQVKYADPREAFLSTKSEMVIVPDSNLKMNMLFDNAMSDTVIIAEDQNGFYVTGKSYVGALTMDPYRSYPKTRATVSVTKTETGFDITNNVKGIILSIKS